MRFGWFSFFGFGRSVWCVSKCSAWLAWLVRDVWCVSKCSAWLAWLAREVWCVSERSEWLVWFVAVHILFIVPEKCTIRHVQVGAAFESYAQVAKYFKEWLVFGTAAPPPDVQCDNVSSWFYRGPNKTAAHVANITLSAVVTGAFTNSDGQFAAVVASISALPQRAAVTVPTPTVHHPLVVATSRRTPTTAAATVLKSAHVLTRTAPVLTKTAPVLTKTALVLKLYDSRRQLLQQWSAPFPPAVNVLLGPYGVAFVAYEAQPASP
jgi:hypothetical protein